MSEHGFYHPDVGYWQTNNDVPQDILSTYPEGTIEVDLKPVEGFWELEGTHWVPCDPPEPTFDEQVAEIEATFERKKTVLAGQLSTVLLFDGPEEAAKITELKTAYTAAFDERAAALEALLFGEL